MDAFTTQYLRTALWAGVDDDGEPLDDNYGIDDFADDAIQQAIQDCTGFLAMFGEDISWREEDAAHDLLLTRNHHGAGFWDGDWAEPLASRMTDYAHALGERYAYVGDDGKLYMS